MDLGVDQDVRLEGVEVGVKAVRGEDLREGGLDTGHLGVSPRVTADAIVHALVLSFSSFSPVMSSGSTAGRTNSMATHRHVSA